ncbi:hypothetical protein ACTFIZ_007839, partial [Dictyostelium cf. discoideum]
MYKEERELRKTLLTGYPQKREYCMRVYETKFKKPNSVIRKVAKVTMELQKMKEKVRNIEANYLHIAENRGPMDNPPFWFPDMMQNKGKGNWNEWLAGLIDGAGRFPLSAEGYANLTIILPIKDIGCLIAIKNKLGGTINIHYSTATVQY